MQATAKIFPIDFPIDRNMSSSTKLYQNVHKLLLNRVRQSSARAQLNNMNTHERNTKQNCRHSRATFNGLAKKLISES
ncbi:unannotated protein [freshwater metagenome]|uniref:Unannotated protein n=1 Tax=freshwater metagenome TaxID=449393 RepID=A0A6J7C9S7_9ZZZZ